MITAGALIFPANGPEINDSFISAGEQPRNLLGKISRFFPGPHFLTFKPFRILYQLAAQAEK
jgi:hypothetical protein